MAVELTEVQRHALGIIGGVAFGLERATLRKTAKELIVLGLVSTVGAHSGHNRSTYHWDLTSAGRELLVEMVARGEYPLARHTRVGCTLLAQVGHMTANGPLVVWPAIKHGGRPGYSTRHFRAMAGAPEDPLRVAARIDARVTAEAVAIEARVRLAKGADLEEVLDWQTTELNRRNEARWAALCGSFDAVLAVLKSAPPTPAIRTLICQAERAQRDS